MSDILVYGTIIENLTVACRFNHDRRRFQIRIARLPTPADQWFGDCKEAIDYARSLINVYVFFGRLMYGADWMPR